MVNQMVKRVLFVAVVVIATIAVIKLAKRNFPQLEAWI